jgi:hypothetical protein
MSFSSFRGVRVRAAAAVLAIVVPSIAGATDDHLSCFKVKAPSMFDAATIDLGAALPGYDLTGCTVKAKAATICVPSERTSITVSGGAPIETGDFDAAPYRICYKLKCPRFAAQQLEASDHFGTMTAEVVKPSVVCLPAVEGEPCIDVDADTYCVSDDDCDDTDEAVNPGATEVCNGRDDDCDGATDESDPDLGAACSTGMPGVCAAGSVTCASGSESCAQFSPPSSESCNGLDDDCDGSTDESISQACYSGPAGTAGVGACQIGTQSCSSGSFGSCTGETTPSSEVCNNADDDCDGSTDESVSQACYSGPAGTAGVGVCHTGTQNCSSGSFGSCLGEATPSSEVCNNADDDCDGAVDDGVVRTCYSGPAGTAGVGACTAGTQTCSMGGYGACNGQVVPATESCADSLDNDCDGQVNEGC